MDSTIGLILIGIAIFFARIVDVSLGTVRIISIVQGRTWIAFFVGFFEIIIWITVISTVVHFIKDRPVLGIFYALGFATGSLVGIKIEKRIAFGHIILRVISRKNYKKMTEVLRNAGYAVTTFQGEGLHGPVVELCIVCRRRDQRDILNVILDIEPDAFYMAEQAGLVSKIYRPVQQPATGWRALLKKK
ncbi:MAG: DUF5698 domain-containing protein [Desulfobulbaceae bacterium]|nr:DUF5698 domain-containing protein [Desulfobulbaceae bacterium]